MSNGAEPLKNPRWEAYAQSSFAGMTSDEAHTAAGFKANRRNAARLKTNQDIQARIAFLQSQAADRAAVTVDDIVRQLDADRAFARTQKSPSAAVQATMGKAKVLGLIVNRHVVGLKAIDDMNEAELRALLGIAERNAFAATVVKDRRSSGNAES